MDDNSFLVTLPVFGLLVLGVLLRRTNFLNENFWQQTEKLNYHVLFPVMLVLSMARADLSGVRFGGMAISIYGALAIMTGIVIFLQRVMRFSGPELASMIQGVIRQNAFIGLAVLAQTQGAEGVAAGGVAMGLITPFANIVSVAALVRWGGATSGSLWRTLWLLISNPFIIAIVIGFGLNLAGIHLPGPLASGMGFLADAALPIGLLCAGAAVTFDVDAKEASLAFLTTGLRLLGVPAITYILCVITGVDGVSRMAAVIFNSLPTAVAGYILTRKLGGDARLIATIIAVQLPAAMLTLPLVVWFLSI
ncbi:AEC family transporter [Radicibacter daui]|uniref:AEC family transporter n=1 Tax=Radicibacter daui TaxID=3064829 RepID=UPI004046CF42